MVLRRELNMEERFLRGSYHEDGSASRAPIQK
jgi:hypothetical protein